MNDGQRNLLPEELGKMSIKKAVEALLTLQPREAAHLVARLPDHREKQIKDMLFDKHYHFFSDMRTELLVEGFNEHMLQKKAEKQE
jgi:hypothetical protein